jgi:creatinine amidohydrolase/Fe(II)-dependent formamide hydrolase-like protein
MTENRNFDEGTEPASRRQRAIETYGNARNRASESLDEAPLIALAGGLAAGALIAALLPRTRTEERLVRPYANRAKETARSAARAAKDAGRGRLDELGLTKDKGKDAVRSIIDGAREAVRASAQAAAGSVRGE